MGSVSMSSQAPASSRGERLSAFVDGELLGEERPNTYIAGLGDEDRAAWSCYHLIGDALRSDDLAMSGSVSSTFMSGFAARFERELPILAPRSAPLGRRLLALRHRVVPAFAVAAAAATLTWIVVPQLQGVNGGHPGGTQVAMVAGGDSLQRVAQLAVPSQPAPQDANIIRDASLDQYLDAHQQFAQQPSMAGTMPLIRATMTTQGQ